MPVELHHWEFYLASQLGHSTAGWSGTAPQVEINFGAAPGLQLHVIAPLAFTAAAGAPSRAGYGDTELGAKYCFLHESAAMPEVGVFPMVEAPTGEPGLGSGYWQVKIPVWIQQDFGAWSSYGGGGIGLELGKSTPAYGFAGWEIQRQLLPSLALGAECYYSSPEAGAPSSLQLNAGLIWAVTDLHHLMISAGPDLLIPGQYQVYAAYQLTAGPLF